MECSINAKVWQSVVGILNEMRDEISFKFLPAGLDIRQIDLTHTVGCHMTLPKEIWESYTPVDEPILLSVLEMSRYLKRLKGGDIVVLKGDLEKESTLYLGIRGVHGFRRFGLPVMEVGEDNRDPAEIKKFVSDVKAKVAAPALAEAIADATAVVGGTKKEITSGMFTVEARSKPNRLVIWATEEGTFRSSWYEFPDGQSLLEMECTSEKIRANYGIPQMKPVLNGAGLSNIVKVEYAEDFPIKFTYQLSFKGRLEFYIAPRIRVVG